MEPVKTGFLYFVTQTMWYCREYTYPLPCVTLLDTVKTSIFSISVLYHMFTQNARTYVRCIQILSALLTTEVTSVWRGFDQSALHLNVKRFLFHAARDRTFARFKTHCGIKADRLLCRTAGSIQSYCTTAFCVVAGSFNQPPSDPVPSAITGNVKAVDNQTVFVQFRQQHDFTDDRIAVKRTKRYVPSR